jgi:hypothetical protein
MKVQVDAARVDFVEERDQVLQRSAKPVDAPSDDTVELPSHSILAESIELRAFVHALGNR